MYYSFFKLFLLLLNVVHNSLSQVTHNVYYSISKLQSVFTQIMQIFRLNFLNHAMPKLDLFSPIQCNILQGFPYNVLASLISSKFMKSIKTSQIKFSHGRRHLGSSPLVPWPDGKGYKLVHIEIFY